MTPRVQFKGIREGLLAVLGEGDWHEQRSALLQAIDQQSDFLRGGKLYLDVGNSILNAIELGGLRDEISDRGISLWGVISSSGRTEQTAQVLGLATRLSRQTEKIVFRSVVAPTTNLEEGDPAIIVRRNLRSGYSLKNDGSVILLGDVNPGAEIVTSGSVIVWGNLRGAAHAGIQGDTQAVVCALELNPMTMRIADVVVHQGENKKSLPRKKTIPTLARLENGVIVYEEWEPTRGKTGGLWQLR
jgi:septum site-determining protein MinC